ncbi:glycosyltransferase family 2 protein [Sphingopyxis sp. LK2115]|uniref:glycosyltransferase family 2 protein n=1 Tax=Sphingopyxis sp. LK2115 TaxID=2744558 RepID=UPI0016601FE0|nr:glycosyltransferase family 2 protein [Sphingopyxis sp. LK2115]
MSDNLVSIITPAYRAAQIIPETIRSVQSQTHGEWEMLIAEDCGPDETREVVREFARADSRVKLLEMPANGGPAAARNLALSAARGRWLAFLDSDDLWLPEKLERQLAFHRGRDDAVISFTGFRRINADGSETGRYIGVPPVMGYKALLGNTAIATSTVIVDRRQSGEFTMKKTYYDDFACWLALLRGGKLAIGLDQDLMRYRVMAQSVSRNKGNSAKQVWLAYRNIEKLPPVIAAWYFAQYSARAFLKYRKF